MTASATALIDEVRLLYHHLVQLVEDLHHGSGISAPQRAVLEYLHRHGPTTVPAMARARGVTRQHIQVLMNELQQIALAQPQDNPAHRRSPVFALTAAGRDAMSDILAREHEYLETHIGDVDQADIAHAAGILAEFRNHLTWPGTP